MYPSHPNHSIWAPVKRGAPRVGSPETSTSPRTWPKHGEAMLFYFILLNCCNMQNSIERRGKIVQKLRLPQPTHTAKKVPRSCILQDNETVQTQKRADETLKWKNTLSLVHRKLIHLQGFGFVLPVWSSLNPSEASSNPIIFLDQLLR